MCSSSYNEYNVVQLVEQSPGEVQESSAEELLGCIERLQALKSKKKGATGKQDVGTTAQAI